MCSHQYDDQPPDQACLQSCIELPSARACSELELRKSGAKGRVVVDDPTKYPGKDDIGPLGEFKRGPGDI